MTNSCAPRLVSAAAILAALAGTTSAAPTPARTSLLPGGETDPAAPVICAQAKLEQALRLAASQAADPAAAMLAMRLSLERSHACYPDDLTVQELAEILAQYQALPPVIVFEGGLRFFTQNTVWTGDVSSGNSGRATPARLTYSFVPDGANWDGQPNTLNATLTQNFGAGNEDRGKEYIRQALAAWRVYSGLRYREVADNGSNRSSSMTRSSARGDIRIGGNARGVPNYLAYNYFPGSGGDMLINTSYFNPGSAMGNAANNYRYLRNVVAHEHGHGAGYRHTVPCENNKLMEPFINTNFETLNIDERRGAGRNYGDRYAGNSSAASAHDFGDLTAPVLRSVIERDLSTNGANGFGGSGADWFRFTLSSPQPVTITVTPTGGQYNNGEQTNDCAGSYSLINAQQAGNLNVELRNSNGATVLQSAASAGAGQPEVLSAGALPAGTYTVRVYDAGPNSNQTVQLYDLAIRVGPGGGAPARPMAIAGIDKRCAANVNCYFMGNINSRALEPGSTIVSYAWDTDGDGVFEFNQPQPVRQYVSNGVYPVTLRITDSNGMVATDTINVTVYGAVTSIGSVTPADGPVGSTVPIIITGANFKNVTSASMVTVSGSGVSVVGVPVPNAMGTEITGLSLSISPSAPLGPRNITISNADGSATGVGLFTVTSGQPDCPADWNHDQQINSNDISAFLNAWLASVQGAILDADFNNDGQVNSNDISAFLSAWLEAVQSGC